MQNTDLLTYKGKPKDNQILVYKKDFFSFHLVYEKVFKSKREAQHYYASRYTVDSMPYSDLWYQKGKVYRRLFPSTRRACKELIDRINKPTPPQTTKERST